MRDLLLSFAVLGAVGCSPTITPGSYLCGPEMLCPEGQQCNGADNVCVEPRNAVPFTCGRDHDDLPGDDTPASGTPLGELGCVSNQRVMNGCLVDGDPGDFVQFDVPSVCTSVGVSATVVYPIAFVPLSLVFAKGSETPTRSEIECPESVQLFEGEDIRCLEVTLEPGAHYAIGVVPDDAADADCDGACRANRYQLRVGLETP